MTEPLRVSPVQLQDIAVREGAVAAYVSNARIEALLDVAGQSVANLLSASAFHIAAQVFAATDASLAAELHAHSGKLSQAAAAYAQADVEAARQIAITLR